jgi:heavy metal efflux system protein
MLHKIIHWSVTNKLIVGIMTLGLIVWGIFSLKNLPIDAVPDITNNQVQIVTSSPSSGAEDIERYVTFPVEQTMATIPGIEEIRSFSRFGLSMVTVVFTEKTDIYWARQQVSERLSEAKNQIPTGFGEPYMAPLSTGLGEIYQYIVKPKNGFENKYDATELRTIQDWMIRRQLLGVEGVADVSGFGGKLKQYEIAVDLVRLKGFGLTVGDVFKAVEQNNQNTGGAYIERNSSTTYIRTEGLMKSEEDIEQTIISQSSAGTPILVKDVAHVQIGSAVRYGALTYNATGEAVGGIVMMLKGANSSKVIENVKERMEQIKKTLPQGVEIEVYLDRTKLVNNAISTVSTNLIEGALIVIFVLVLLLGNLRAGLIVASVIPLAMLFAISLMNVFGVSGNLMSLGALDFGLIIDGAVIIVESTLHFLYHKGNQKLTQQQMDAQVYQSASKFSKSAVFGQVIILVVYLPLLALVGIEGKMFQPMAQTVMFAVIGALILSLTYVPMISALFLKKNIVVKENISDKIVRFVGNIYKPVLNAFLRRQKTVLAGLALLIVVSVALFGRLGAEFIPSLDEGDFAVETRLITGTSLTKTIDATTKVSDVLLKNFPEVKEVVGKIGTAEIPTDPMPMEACDLMVILKDRDEWVSASTKEELAGKMQKTLEDNVPGVSFGFLQPIQMRFNELMTGAKQDVVVKIYGEDLDQLSSYAQQIGALSSKIEGVKDVYVEEVTGLPQMIVTYQRESLSKYNISIEEVNRAINISFAGQAAGLIFEGEKRFDLVVKLDSTNRKSIEDLKTITIASPLGVMVPLDQLADVKFEKGPNQIQRDDAKRRIIVGFNVRGRDVQSIVQELQKSIDNKVKFEPGYYPTFGGTFKNLENARNRLAIAVPVALFMIFFLLYLTFQSLKQAALIFSAIPLAALGGILALWSRDMPFSISAGVGFIALFGVAVLNGIVLISEFNSLKKSGYTNRLRIVLMGTRVRLRPVMLTALVASLGFLPMALSHGSGAEVQKPLATVVIGGLITATILTLFVLPIFYLFSERKMKRKPKTSSVALTILMLISFSTVTQAQKALSLKECLELAKNNNQTLKVSDLQIQKELLIGRSNAALPKTAINGMYGQYNSYYSGDNNFTISQTIPFPTVFSKERQLGEVKSDQAIIMKESTWRDLELEISTSYERLQFLKVKQKSLNTLDSVYSVLEKRFEVKFEQRDVSKLDFMLISTKRKEVQNLLQLNQQEISSEENRLTLLVGSKESVSSFGSNNDLLSFSRIVDSTQLKSHPNQRYFELQEQVIQKEKEVLVSRALPDITLGYVNQTLVGIHSVDGVDQYFDNSHRFQAGQIGLEIPLFFGSTKRKATVLNTEIEQNSIRKEYVLRELESGFSQTYTKYKSLLNSLDLFQNQLIPQTFVMKEQMDLLLETGEISMIEYLQTKQAIIDIEMNHNQLRNDINTTVHQLNWFVQNQK